ncbi:hypothetical protein FRC01_008785, partial [Tulasnella sp. 417]
RDDPYQTFNDLPVELIALILETVLNEVTNLPYFQGGYYLGTLKALAAVCRTWKLIIQSTPSFWAVIESNATSREVQYILRKAEKYALTFRHVTQTIPGRPTSRFAKQDFLALAKFNMYRCSSLSVWVEDDKQAAYILTSPAPVLRKATVIASKCLPNQSINLFDGRAPMLEDLNLSRIPIKWDLAADQAILRISVHRRASAPAQGRIRVIQLRWNRGSGSLWPNFGELMVPLGGPGITGDHRRATDAQRLEDQGHVDSWE